MADHTALPLLVAAILVVGISAFLRLLYILPATSRHPKRDPRQKYPKREPSHLVAVLGSGGHTAEMMSLLRNIDPARYTLRTYIISSGDKFSSVKALEIETSIQSRHKRVPSGPTQPGELDPITGSWDVKVVPRARKIHQPLYSTPFSSLSCLIGCLKVLHEASRTSNTAGFEYADVIVTNGPATAVIVILAGTILKFFGIVPLWKMKTIYVESWARVKTLSLSGKLLLWMGVCDKFLVQWEELAKSINGSSGKEKVEWRGFLVE